MTLPTLLLLLLLISCSTNQKYVSRETESLPYNRSEWTHWNRIEGCQDTRAYLLKKRSMAPVTYTKRKDHRDCTIATGRWDDFYYEEVHTIAKEVDLDHLVPLHHAHSSGGASWSRERKQQFANDPLNLVITKASYNRQKGAKTPMEWMPVDRSYACRYMEQWFEVKNKYDLVISPMKFKFYEELGCSELDR